jgi:hypothetical protein
VTGNASRVSNVLPVTMLFVTILSEEQHGDGQDIRYSGCVG